ncbi:MAG TPA: hypothetical protein VNN13_01255 [Methylomirabilota bacterium]|nr:hypothetical protein [Methylomirabilota bacterium]
MAGASQGVLIVAELGSVFADLGQIVADFLSVIEEFRRARAVAQIFAQFAAVLSQLRVVAAQLPAVLTHLGAGAPNIFEVLANLRLMMMAAMTVPSTVPMQPSLLMAEVAPVMGRAVKFLGMRVVPSFVLAVIFKVILGVGGHKKPRNSQAPCKQSCEKNFA